MTTEIILFAENESALEKVPSFTAELLFKPGVPNDILNRIKAEVRSVETDISTEKGRKEIASLAYKVARIKTFLDEQGKNLTEEIYKQKKLIDNDRKKYRDELDALKDVSIHAPA